MSDNLAVRWLLQSALPRCSTKEIRQLSDATVIFYFAHGLGDFVMFNNVVPFLTGRNNQLYITRFGDDYIAIQDNCESLKPFYTGVDSVSCNDGATYDNPHFQLFAGRELQITATMKKQLAEFNNPHICVENFPEPVWRGNDADGWPFHSKPRSLIASFKDHLLADELEALKHPLPNAINTAPNPFVDALVDRRLRTFTPYTDDTKIVVITRYGLTSCGKNWGHSFRSADYPAEGDEARKFIEMCRKKNKSTIFVSMEHRGIAAHDSLVDHAKNVYGFAELFSPRNANDLAIPYAMLLMALFHKSRVHVGCATGASGVASLFNNLCNVIVWPELFPSWYFEPTQNTTNIIGCDKIEDRRGRKYSFDTREHLHYNNVYVNTPYIAPSAVFDIIEDAL